MKAWTKARDRNLKELAGHHTVEDIGESLGRTPAAIRSRAQVLGVSLKVCGELHSRAKLSNCQVEMVKVLHHEGFTIAEIQREAFQFVHHSTLGDITRGYTRVRA